VTPKASKITPNGSKIAPKSMKNHMKNLIEFQGASETKKNRKMREKKPFLTCEREAR